MKKAVSLLLLIVIAVVLVLTPVFSSSASASDFSDNYDAALKRVFHIYGDVYPELADEYPYVDVDDRDVAKFVKDVADSYTTGFYWIDCIRDAYIVPNDGEANINSLIDKLPQLQFYMFDFSYSAYWGERCYKINLNNELGYEFEQVFANLTFKERIYLICTLYAYIQNKGDCSIYFGLVNGSPSYYPTYKKDVDYSGAINVLDVTCLKNYISGLAGRFNLNAVDQNKDGAVNIKDLLALKKYVAGAN